ncbi:transcription factor WhiB [Peterkaempfera sp. SMS 1(5)a]|uniref:transcription factor WhiB n=1 Tax=Peterkaempfera podocarpi TaxID=3232308 RepID=UPI00366A9FE8
MTGWTGGLHIRGLPIPGHWETEPIADYLCTHCGHHKRATGKAKVAALVLSARTDHQATCPANQQAPTRKATHQ